MSVFEGRPPVLIIPYTVACGAVQRPLERAVPADIDGPRMFYCHTDKVHEYNAVINSMRQGGLYRVKPESQRWVLFWSNHPPPEVLRALKPTQRCNHFPGSFHIARKDLLWRNICRMMRRFPEDYTITPTGFVLPKAYPAWEAARQVRPDALWIWKPCKGSCGRGIKVLSSGMPNEEARDLGRKRGIIQRYIGNPLLIDGFKFDLRIYVVVVSFDPLKVYINDEGLVRIATEKYSATPDTLESRTMHLTNYSVNKFSPAFVQNKDGRNARNSTAGGAEGGESGEGGEGGEEEDGPASKWSLRELQANFAQRGLDYGVAWEGIKDVVIKTLIAVEPAIQAEWAKGVGDEDAGWHARGPAGAHSSSSSSCFEMYGFDILIDENLKAWLLEVNICPSLSSGSPLDKRIKTKFVADTLTLVGIRAPPCVWRPRLSIFPPAAAPAAASHGGTKRSSPEVDGATVSDRDSTEHTAWPIHVSAAEQAERATALASCKSPLDALPIFDELAWEAVMETHEQDMRSGGLTRIYPTSRSADYVPFMTEESYLNLALRRWYEAGGGNLFSQGTRGHELIPPWVPKQVIFTQT